MPAGYTPSRCSKAAAAPRRERVRRDGWSELRVWRRHRRRSICYPRRVAQQAGHGAAAVAQVQLEANQTEAGMRVGGVTPTINMPRTREMLEGDLEWRMGKSGAEDVTLTFTRIQLEADSRATDGHLHSSAAPRPRRRRGWQVNRS